MRKFGNLYILNKLILNENPLKKEQIASNPSFGVEAIDILYGDSINEGNSGQLQYISHNKSIERLGNIIKIFQGEQEKFDNNFQCFIERTAFNAFIAFADEAIKSWP